MTTWRERLAPIIAAALDSLPEDATLKEKRRALRDAYPKLLGRVHWPYKVWLDECRKQLKLPPRERRHRMDGHPKLFA